MYARIYSRTEPVSIIKVTLKLYFLLLQNNFEANEWTIALCEGVHQPSNSSPAVQARSRRTKNLPSTCFSQKAAAFYAHYGFTLLVRQA
jgi:hypothetical protein